MILERNIVHRVDSHMYTQKNSNYLRSHSRAVMALDQSRLGLEKNSWKTNQTEFFDFDKFTLQNLANKSGGV